MTKYRKLTPLEKRRGWAEFHCPEHGFLVATAAQWSVTCKCKKSAAPKRSGRTLRALQIAKIQSEADAYWAEREAKSETFEV